MGQYITTTVESGRYYCAMAKDNAENIYAVRYNAGVGKYEVVKYRKDGAPVEVLYTGLGLTTTEYPWGLAVADNGDVFVTDPGPAGWRIVKLDASAGYAVSFIQTGKYYSALAVDNTNNLLAMEFHDNGANDTYRLVRYPANNESAPGTVVYDGLAFPTSPGGTYPWGIVVDNADNIYLLDFLENSSGGNLVKLSPPQYNAPVIINSGKYFSSLAIDNQNNIYTTESLNGTNVAHIMKYTQPLMAGQTGTEVYSGLTIQGGLYPWGLAVTHGGAIYVNDGGYDVGDANGRLLEITPNVIQAESVARKGTSPTGATEVDFTVTFSAPAIGVSSAAFSPILTGTLTGASIVSVTGGRTTYTVRVNTGTGEGTAGLAVTGAGMTTQTIANAPYTSGEIYTIDRIPPTILQVTPPANGYYHLGNPIDISVKYSEAVFVTGTPYINIDISGVTRQAIYFSGSTSDNLVFRYVVQAGDKDLDGIGMDQNILLNNGTIKDQLMNNAPLAFGPSGISGVKVNTVPPQVNLTMSEPSPVNNSFNVIAIFSEPVTDFTLGDLSVVNAVLSSLSTTDNATYTFSVMPSVDGPVSIELQAGLVQNSAGLLNLASNTISVTYDATDPVVTSVDLPAGTFKAGEVLDFKVHFGEPVFVTAGNPYINVTVGSTAHQAVISGGSGTNVLTFSYTVQPGEQDLDGVSLAANIDLAGSNIRDQAGNGADLALQNLDADIPVVDARPPVVTSVDVPPSGYYKAGDVLNFTVHMSEDIVVTGTPSLNLVIGSETRPALFTVAASNTITFMYTVAAGDQDLDGIALPVAISLNGGAIHDSPGNNALPDLQNPSSTSNLFIDNRKPSVVLSGTVQVNAPFDLTVTFSDGVTGFDAGDVTATNADISNLRTTDNIVYTVTVTPRAEGGVVLQVLAGVAVSRADVGNTPSNSLSYYYDPNPPAITAVELPSTGTYIAGDDLTFDVHFNENVKVNNGPGLSLPVILGGATVQAAYLGGGGTNVLTFFYQVQVGDLDADGVSLGASLQISGGAWVVDLSGNAANLALQNVNSNVAIVDAIPPVVTSVAVPANGYYQTGDVLTFTVNFNEDITATGTPSLGITIGSVTRQAAMTGGVNNTLTFSYTVQSADVDLDGIAVAAALSLNGGTIRDGVGNNASLTLNNTGNTTNVRVYNGVPSVQLTGTPVANAPFTLSIVFSEAVTDFAIADITANNATISNLQTADNITYTVLVTPVSNGSVRLEVPAGVAFNVANTGNTASNVIAYTYDGTAPVVTAVGVPANGYYKTSNVLTFTVSFNENITVTGTPSMAITIGGTTRQAALTGSTVNTLTFSYTVQSADIDLDGIALAVALSLNGGTIRDGAGNNANLTLNNAGNTSNVRIYSVVPSVQLAGTPSLNAPFTLSVIFSEAVTGFAVTGITANNAAISNLQTSDNITYTATVTPVADGPVQLQVPADVAVNIANTGNTASNLIAYTYDGTVPVITAVDVPANGYYKAATALNFTVHYSEPVNVNTGMPSLPVVIGTSTVQAAYVSGSGTNALLFRYTVQSGDMDTDGISLGAALLLSGATMRDAAGNNALLALNNVAPADRVFVNTARPSATLSTTAEARLNTPFQVTLTFSEAVTGLVAGDFTLNNATAGTPQTIDNITYSIPVTPTADGTVSISLPADAAVNIGGNGNTASNSVNRTYDATAPVIAAGQNFTMTQFTAGTVAGKITATEAAGTLQNWTIATGGSNGAFTIAADGTISILDAAKARALENTTVTLGITVSDGLNTSVNTPISIRMTAVNKAPVLDVIADVTMCFATDTRTIQLTGASATEPAQTYTLTVTASQDYFDQLSVNTAGLLSYRLKNNATSGSVTVTVTIKDNGGTANGGVDAFSRSFTLRINSLPAVNITSSKGASISKGETTELTASGGTSYIWTDAPGIIGVRNSAVLQVRPLASPAVYEVTATNAAGCSATGEFTIALVSDFKVDATNVLTPNGDGINDRWLVRNLDAYPDNEVKIYDRAGHLVFSQRNYSNTWDGTVNGRPLAEGTYYYVLTIASSGKIAKGFITIVRNKN